MSLFKKKTKTYVNTSVSRLIEDKDIPDLGKAALFDYMYSDKQNRNNYVRVDYSYSDFLALHNENSIGNKLKQARNWAKNSYAYGLLEGDVLDPDKVDIANLMDEYLENKLGKPVRISYAIFSPLNALHFAWKILIDEYAYDANKNTIGKLSAQNSGTVYLKDIQINYCKATYDGLIDPDTIAQKGLAATYGATNTRKQDLTRKHTDYAVDATAEHDYALITYILVKDGVATESNFKIDFLKYEFSGKEPSTGLDDSDTDNYEPEAITPIVTDSRLEHDYIMVQYFTKNTDGTENINYFTYQYGSNQIRELENLFSVSRQLGKYFPNIYFRLMGTNLASDVYKDTDEYKSSKIICRKLGLNYTQVSDQLHEAVGSIGDVTQMLISCQLNVNDDDPMVISYFYDYFYSLYNQLPDKFAKSDYSSLNTEYVNGYAKSGLTVTISDKVYSSNINFSSIGYEDVEGVIGDVGFTKKEFTKQEITNNRGPYRSTAVIPVHIFYRQIAAKVYRKICIYGLSTTQQVTGGHTTTAADTSGNLIIPLDSAVADRYDYKTKAKLYSKSLVIILNTIKVVKQKWYETGIFKAVMFIIAVIVSIYTNGAGMSVYAVLYAAAQALVIGAIINIVVKFLVVKLNLKIGAIFAVVAIILIVMGGASLANGSKMIGMTSTQFMQAASYSVAISNAATKIEMNELIKAHTAYADLMQDKMEQLKELADAADPKVYLNPAYLLSDSIRGPDIRPGEQINDFLIRTLSVDSGLATLDTITNMVELTVRLPTFQETYSRMNGRGKYYGFT